MRGSTIKKIKEFVDILIENTPPEQRNKSREQMINEVKSFWNQDPKARKFVHDVVNGNVGV